MDENEMIKSLLNQICNINSIKKIFMKKRDVKVYDESWNKVSRQVTEYDVEIIANLIERDEWKRIVAVEKEFNSLYPMFKFNYNLIENDNNANQQSSAPEGRLIYDAETPINFD